MIISRDGGMGGIVAVGGGREPEEKTMVVAVSAVAGEGEEGAKGRGSVSPPRRRPEGAAGTKGKVVGFPEVGKSWTRGGESVA